MQLSYLKQLNDRYDRFMTEQYHGRAITINVDDLDFVNRREDFEYIIGRIDEQLSPHPTLL
jgi:deoxyadenosine/deoxycytidine kinase